MVHIWHICKLKGNYEVHIFIQTQNPKMKLAEDDIQSTVSHAVDELELPTMDSIIVNGQSERVQMSDFARRTEHENYVIFI